MEFVERRKALSVPVDVEAYCNMNQENRVLRAVRYQGNVTHFIHEDGTTSKVIEYAIQQKINETPLTDPDKDGYYYALINPDVATRISYKIH